MPILQVGDWELARRILATGAERVHRAIDAAVEEEAQFMRAKIREGLQQQAPGGSALRPLAPNTIKKRQALRFRGTKALIVRADLLNSIVVRRTGSGDRFVGVLRSARARDGHSLVNIAELNEYGSRPIVIPLTPKMIRFLAMARIGAHGGDAGGGHGGGGGGGRGFVVVQIPARPFIAPVVARYFQPGDVQQRFIGRIAMRLRGDFGGPGGGSGHGGGAGGGGGGLGALVGGLGSALGALSGGAGRGAALARRGRSGIRSISGVMFGGGGGPARDAATGRFIRRGG